MKGRDMNTSKKFENHNKSKTKRSILQKYARKSTKLKKPSITYNDQSIIK